MADSQPQGREQMCRALLQRTWLMDSHMSQGPLHLQLESFALL